MSGCGRPLEHYDYLRRLLSELGAPEHCALVHDWRTAGAVYLDYVNMTQTIEQLKAGEPSGYELEQLQPEVTSLATRIGHLPCRTSTDRCVTRGVKAHAASRRFVFSPSL